MENTSEILVAGEGCKLRKKPAVAVITLKLLLVVMLVNSVTIMGRWSGINLTIIPSTITITLL